MKPRRRPTDTREQKEKRKLANSSSSALDDSVVENTPSTVKVKQLSKRCKKKDSKDLKSVQESGSILTHFSLSRRQSSCTVTDIGLAASADTVRDTVRDSDTMTTYTLADVMAKLEVNNTKIDELLASIHTLKVENDSLKNSVAMIVKEGEVVKSAADTACYRAQMADSRSNDLEQYGRNYNIRMYGVPEAEKETNEQCEEKVLAIFKEKLGLKDITLKDIDVAHRLGERRQLNQERGGRAIIVRFISRRVRNLVISKRRLLKKKPGQKERPVTIVEDLTRNNYQLYQRARMTEGVQECWSIMGKVFVKNPSGQTRRIREQSDLVGLGGPAPTREFSQGQQAAGGTRRPVRRGRGGYQEYYQEPRGSSRGGGASYRGYRGGASNRGGGARYAVTGGRGMVRHTQNVQFGEWHTDNGSDSDKDYDSWQ